jgi:transcriptional regulator
VTQQDSVNALDRQLKALELRKAGVSYDEIANALGFKWRSSAFAAVKRALKEVKREPCQELIVLEAERLDKMQTALWAKAQHGDYGAIDRILKIMQRRAELLGLDAPEKVALTDPTGTEEFGASDRLLLSKLLSDVTDGDQASKAGAPDAKAAP